MSSNYPVTGFPLHPDLVVNIGKLKIYTMETIHTAYDIESIELLCKALQEYVDIDLLEMDEPDFIYLLAVIDKTSFPESTRDFEWHCNADINGRSCDSRNTETVRHFRPIFLKPRQLPEGLRYPKMKTYDRAKELGGDLAQAARWIDSDLDYDSTLKYTSYSDLLEAKQYMHPTGEQEIKLKCAHCITPYTVKRPIDPISYLRVFSPRSILNMKLNLAVAIHSMMPDTSYMSELLYFHSCWEKDKNEAEKKRRLEEAKRGK